MANSATVVAGSTRITVEFEGSDDMSLGDVLAKAQVELGLGQRVAVNGAPVEDTSSARVAAGDRVVVAGTKAAGRN